MTDHDTELAARRAVIASCYGVPPGYVPHCGVCGKPQPCACGTTPAGMVPPIVAPVLPVPAAAPARPVVSRYGVDYCKICGLMIDFCRGHGPSDQGAQDSDLSKRIKDCQAR